MDIKPATILTALVFLATLATALSQAPFTPPEIIVYTDRPVYKPGEQVVILGTVVDEDFNPVSNVTVILLVFDANNNPILDTDATTNQTGVFAVALQLSQAAVEGEYLISVDSESGDFTPGFKTFLVCSICITNPEVVVITTTLPGPTVTTAETTTVQITATATVTTTILTGAAAPSESDTLTLVFIGIVAALFIVVFIAIKKYG